MKVLIVGAGAREHALAWRLQDDPAVRELIVAPGNAGIGASARRESVDVDDLDAIVSLVEREDVDLTVVGPEAPLVAGLADRLADRGRRVFGPSRAAAALEGSKAFAKDLMHRHAIPTARSGTFSGVDEASAFVDELGGRAVVKVDGLAAGKGVTVASDRGTAVTALRASLEEAAFGDAGSTVVVEEVLEGPEVSAFALTDGETVVPLGLAQDFKRVGDDDRGPNTGGMGAYAPLPWVDPDLEERIWGETVLPTARALRAEGIVYRGCLFAGLMLTADGPKVLEFNCRFGDPETEVLMPRMPSGLAEVLASCADGRLDGRGIGDTGVASVAVVLASGGYPGTYETGKEIHGLSEAAEVDGATVFHAGTQERNGRVVTAGGRVLAVSAVGSSLQEARTRAYEACGRISFDGITYRRDIAARAARGEETR
jgi:phosphoribosylamine---glycine ligase